MEILGIGPLELLVILIVALAVFGPDKLPQIGAKLGKALRSMRQATRQFSDEIEQTRQAIEGPVLEAGRPVQEVVQPLEQIVTTVQDAAQAVTHPAETFRQAVVRELARPEPAPAEEGTANPLTGTFRAAASTPAEPPTAVAEE
jgi:TatA/E family protein of Tat protein translocase